MIIQACINGARPAGYHPALPLSTEAMVEAAQAAVLAGAAELHIHPRHPDGHESLGHVDEVVRAARAVCPGTMIGVSTGAWIEKDRSRTRDKISAWSALPDYASVNLSETDAPAIMDLLDDKGVGIEAGLATVADAERFVTLPQPHRVFRVLYEIEEQDLTRAEATLQGIEDVLARAKVLRPILLHGFDATVWHFVRQAFARRWSTRVGLEDGPALDNQKVAPDNAALVTEAVKLRSDVLQASA